MSHLMFATGIECSYPTIALPDGTIKRIDEMEKADHYRRWREDFECVKEIGLEYLRYGPPYYLTHLGRGRYDWEFTDLTFTALVEMGITPIVDLCHFGVPDWLGNFQNPEFPEAFAEYAGAFASRFPHLKLYTPINEIFIAARFSAELGWWNERLASDRAFVNALKHLVRANLLAEEAILKVQPAALFIQSESSEYFHAAEPAAADRADFYNQKRFLSLDLCYGRDVRGVMYEYLMDSGMSREEYHWFLRRGKAVKRYCVMGNDYYDTNEHLVPAGNKAFTASGEIFGYYVITKQYFDRYHLPVMHTETNMKDEQLAPGWLWKQWANMMRLRQDGVPIIGFTWYSLIDQIDWDTLLCEENGRVNPLGLFDLDRKIRPVGEAYRRLVKEWHNTSPIEGQILDLSLSFSPDGGQD
ncbi:MAG: family 1 glycosylhydrolase [Blastocatellia bacterium]